MAALPRWPVRVLHVAVTLLVLIGITAAVARAMYTDDLLTRTDYVRQYLLDALHRTDPLALERPAELDRVDGRFAEHRFITRLHVVAGGLFLLLAPLQFSARFGLVTFCFTDGQVEFCCHWES